MSKTETGFRRPHCLAPVVGGGGYLVTGLFSVNRAFQLLRQFQEPLDLTAKINRAAKRLPSIVRCDSTEAGEHTQFEANIKCLIGACRQLRLEAIPEREAAV